MSPPLIETRNLSKHFGGVQAVRNIDFSLAEGELRCLIGPNGAGKSTFFKLLTGQIKPTGGAVLFRGVDITKLQAHEIARLGIGIKTQVPSVFNGLTARQNLWIAAARHATRKEADAAVDAQIERLGLGRFADKPVGQLAHGQRQWVELALVLCGRPNLILLDEPAAGMTEEERVQNHRDHPRDQSRAPADRGRARYVVHPNDRAAHHRIRPWHHSDGRRRRSGVRQSGRARRLSGQAGGGVILEINNLHAGYGRIPVLSGINFTVGAHEVIGVLGHNGMGKTTLLKTLIGQVPLTGGTIKFAGADVGTIPSFRRARAGMGYVPQGRAIFPNLTVYENLRMGFIENGINSEENTLNDVLARFPRLDSLLDRQGAALSGGEQQILALARCLCGQPKLLLLDEPTEGIQPSIVEEILEILIGLHRHQGLAIVVVEQSLDFIRRLSDRILLIEKGMIMGEVLPDALKQSTALGSFVAAE